jgi:hypothetical protein
LSSSATVAVAVAFLAVAVAVVIAAAVAALRFSVLEVMVLAGDAGADIGGSGAGTVGNTNRGTVAAVAEVVVTFGFAVAPVLVFAIGRDTAAAVVLCSLITLFFSDA